MTPQQKMDILIVKLEKLRQVHHNNGIEITKLREEVEALKKEIRGDAPATISTGKSLMDEVPVSKVSSPEALPDVKIDFSKKRSTPPPLPKRNTTTDIPSKAKTPEKAFDLEAFIGGNLINKIGILILIVGLGLFVKYAIDNGYFPPLIRLILSFLAGLTLVGIGYRLKAKYKTYSAVLFSGGMAVLYFSAYGGNAFYDPILLPKLTAFILMVVFTIVTVIAAIMYGLEIIALLGLVGAYAVPILLGDGSGDYQLLFSYMAIINTGVLLVSVRKLWRLTLYMAFILTWLLFSFWVLVECDFGVDDGIAWVFNITFFIIFYAALLVYRLLHKEELTIDNILFINLNAFIFFGLGFYTLEETQLTKYQGLFTALNGIFHLLVALGIYSRTKDKKFFLTISGLFWIFLTIAIGVQFDAKILPILWLSEAAVLFGLGRYFKVRPYEAAALLLTVLGMGILFMVWEEGYYNSLVHHTAIFNRYFLTSTLAMGILGAMFWMHRKWEDDWEAKQLVNVMIPVLFIGTLYFSFFHEIYHQYEQAFLNSKLDIDTVYQYDLLDFRSIWLVNYTFGFLFILTMINQFSIKDKVIGGILGVLSLFTIAMFLMGGMFVLNSLRESYLNVGDSPSYDETSYWIWIRYITYVFVGLVLYGIYRVLDWYRNIKNIGAYFQLLIYLVVLVVLSNELTTFMRLVVGVETSSLTHRVGFSILWGVYALVMVLVGFRQRSKIVRVAGIALFAVTLVKVFLLDLVDISTESKILLFVAIGVLLLIISYLYQRYKDVLIGEEGEEEGDGA